MHLVVTSRGALLRRLGGRAGDVVDSFVARYEQAQAHRGIRVTVAAIDDDVSMRHFTLPPAGDQQPQGFLQAIRDIAESLRANDNEAIDSILILGGDEIVPFWRLTNPVRERVLDPDDVVLSDNPYGMTADDQYLRPTVPVGRVCDAGSVDVLRDVLEQLLANLETPRTLRHALSAINVQWLTESALAEQAIDGVVERHLCPSFSVTPPRREELAKRLLYFNLHGFSGKPAWSGYDERTDQFINAVAPSSFWRGAVAGAMAVSEACYGGEVVNRSVDSCIALAALREGVSGLIAATGLVFGSLQRPFVKVADADLLAPEILRRLSQGVRAGTALRDGRAAFLDGLGRAPNPYEQKTALQFVLYGDPTLSAA